LYKNYLTTQKDTLSTSIAKVRGNFNESTISELELFSKRYSSANIVLKNHIVLSPLFSLIADLTIPSIQYTKFDHQSTDTGFVVKMSGIARDYKSVAIQADIFNSDKGRYFKNVIFSDLTKDRTNYVLFNVEFTVDPELLSYSKDNAQGVLQANTQAQPKAQPQINAQVALPANVNPTGSSLPAATGATGNQTALDINQPQ